MAFQAQVLKQCTKILHEIECEKNPENPIDARQFEDLLEGRYQRYRQQKQSKHKAVLEYHEFVALCSITADREAQTPFLFQYTKLSFTIMCSHCDSRKEAIINLSAFEKWATKMHPLATKQNYKRVFLALASDVDANGDTSNEPADPAPMNNDSSFGRFGNQLRQRMNEYTQNSKPKRSLSRESNISNNIQQEMNKSIYGGITMTRFCGYVKALAEMFSIEQRECQGMESLLSGHERILYHIRGVSDMTGLPPYYGFVILTDYHLIFQGTALTTRTTSIKLNDDRLEVEKAKIGGFLKRDTALKITSEQGTFSWNVVNIKSVRRDELFWSIWTMIKAHELAERCASILREEGAAGSGNKGDGAMDEEMVVNLKRRIIVEAAEDVLRQNALQSLLSNDQKNPFDAVPFVRYGTATQKRDYVLCIKRELVAIEEQLGQRASGGVIGSLFTGIGLIGGGSRKNTDPRSVTPDTVDPDEAIRMKKYAALKSDFERETRAKKLEAVSTSERVEFDVMEFLKHIKVLRVQLEPVVFLYRLFQCIRQWKNPGLSLLVLIVLQFIAYFDYVAHLPALLLIANAILLVSFRKDGDGTIEWCNGILAFSGFDEEDFEQEKLAAEKYVNQKYGKSGSGNDRGIWSRIKEARYQFSMTRFSMGFHQKKLADISVILGRFRTIYKWDQEDKSQIFCLFSLALGIALMLVSLRSVFSVVVFSIFFKHNPWRAERNRKSKGMVDRYWESIQPDIPTVDDDDASDAENGEEQEMEDDDEAKREQMNGDDDDARWRQMKMRNNQKRKPRAKKRTDGNMNGADL